MWDLPMICFSWVMFAGFLTAMRQEVTRANKGWALDTVTLYNKVLKQTMEEITMAPTVSLKPKINPSSTPKHTFLFFKNLVVHIII